MSKSLLRRLDKLEGTAFRAGPILLTSSCPLPNGTDWLAFIAERKAEGMATQRGRHVHIRTPLLTTADWIHRFAPKEIQR